MADLFAPYHFRSGLTALNRLALASMTNRQSHEDGRLGDDELEWLRRRAIGGFGTILTCASHVMPSGKGFPGQLGIHGDQLLPGLRRLAQMLREHQTLGIVQLYHGGLRSPSLLTGVQPVSASALPAGELYGEGARAATEAEIEEIIEAFVAAANRARYAGFRGVEIHGAHGYLITQFLDSATNKRDDRWGGPLENRLRLLMEIVRRIRSYQPRDFIIGVRISPEAYQPGQGLVLQESLEIARQLEAAGVDYLHVSLSDVFRKPIHDPGGTLTVLEHFARLPRQMALMVAGGVQTADHAKRALDLGADFAALGRIALAHSDWPRRVTDPKFSPQLPPYSPAYLADQGLGPAFVYYMKRWKNFMIED